MALLADVILRGPRAIQPAATTVGAGTLYCVTDEAFVIERSTSLVWEAYSPAASGGAPGAHAATHAAGGTDPIAGPLTLVSVQAGYVDLPEGLPGAAPAADVARMYAVDEGGFTFPEYMDAGGGRARPLRDNVIVAKALEPITRGQVVYLAGASGANKEIRLAKADSGTTMPAVGLAGNPAATNGFVRVLLLGQLAALDTSAYAEGAPLWVSATVAGGWAPTPPALPQRLGMVVRSHAVEGEILVMLGAAETLAGHAATHEPGGTDPLAVDAAAATGSLRTLGPGALQAAPGDDARFTDARAPTAHAPTHQAAGSDPLTAIDAAILTGTVADARLSANVPLKPIPASDLPNHATRHNTGGPDPLTALDAAVLTTGTLANARLSANVPLKDVLNVFTGVNVYESAVIVRSPGAAQALTGDIRGDSSFVISARNVANTADINLTMTDGTNIFLANSTEPIYIGNNGVDPVRVRAPGVAIGTNPAQTGALRLANNQSISARNAANTADQPLLKSMPNNDTVLGATGSVVLDPGGTVSYWVDSSGIYPDQTNVKPLGLASLQFSHLYVGGLTIGAAAGVDGSFTTANGKTVTVTKGVITAIV